MRRNIFLFAIAVLFACGMSSLFTSCQDKKTKEGLNLPEAPLITLEDTMRAFSMTKEYMEALKNNKIDSALSLLVYYPEDTVMQLPDEVKMRLKQQNKIFPVKDYSIETSHFKDQYEARVTYKYRFMDPPADDPNYPVTMNVTLQVKFYQGEYYLSLYDHTIITRDNTTEEEREFKELREQGKEQTEEESE